MSKKESRNKYYHTDKGKESARKSAKKYQEKLKAHQPERLDAIMNEYMRGDILEKINPEESISNS